MSTSLLGISERPQQSSDNSSPLQVARGVPTSKTLTQQPSFLVLLVIIGVARSGARATSQATAFLLCYSGFCPLWPQSSSTWWLPSLSSLPCESTWGHPSIPAALILCHSWGWNVLSFTVISNVSLKQSMILPILVAMWLYSLCSSFCGLQFPCWEEWDNINIEY